MNQSFEMFSEQYGTKFCVRDLLLGERIQRLSERA